jgi:polysaccharide pyruvyl transferase WcaK-like protein
MKPAHSSEATRRGRRARPYDVALFGIFGVGNFGNDATLEVCLSELGEVSSRTRVLCVTSNPEFVADHFAIATTQLSPPILERTSGRFNRFMRVPDLCAMEIKGLARAWRTLRGVRTLVIAGTGLLDDQHATPRLALDVFRWSLAARLASTRLVVLSVGAGPLDHRLGRVLSKATLRLAQRVTYRDQRSWDYMRSIGRNVEHDEVVPDIVFAMPRAGAPIRSGESQRQVAIGVLWSGNWRGRPAQYRQYQDRIVDLITQLHAGRWKIWLIIGDLSDADTIDAIATRSELTGCDVTIPDTQAFGDVVDVARESAALVASRYHNLVAGVLAATPVISLGYGPKNVALLETIEQPEHAHDIDDFDVEELIQEIELVSHAANPNHAPVASFRARIRTEFEAICNA